MIYFLNKGAAMVRRRRRGPLPLSLAWLALLLAVLSGLLACVASAWRLRPVPHRHGPAAAWGTTTRSGAGRQRRYHGDVAAPTMSAVQGPRLRFAADAPGILRHVEPAVRRLLQDRRARQAAAAGGAATGDASDDILSPASSVDIRKSEVATLLETLVLEDHPFLEEAELSPEEADATPRPPRPRRPLHIPLAEDAGLGYSISLHILPFAGDEIPPCPPASSKSSGSGASGGSTLTLSRLLYGAMTARRHAYRGDEDEERSTHEATHHHDSPREDPSAVAYCPCFGGRVCPREACEWRVTLAPAEGRRERIREEVALSPESPLLILDDDDRFSFSCSKTLSLHAREPSILLEVTFNKAAPQPSPSRGGGAIQDGDLEAFSPGALSSLPFPLSGTPLIPDNSFEEEETKIVRRINAIAPPIVQHRRAADGAISIEGWATAADAPDGGEWGGGQDFEWTPPPSPWGGDPAGAGGEGVVPQWGTAPEDRLRELGVGGLDRAFQNIFRRVFASRLAPPELVREMGLRHVRGALLYGPPGCGKTILARQMGKLLDTREPKVVNGPEVLGSLVGESEANVRELFEDAEREQREMGDRSKLHLIILDEVDSILSKRGASPAQGYRDTVVNQLLSKLDGVNALNNVLVIGMTNRKDMIDEAVLRPGRLEVQVEVGMPDAEGRQQILAIHTAAMRASGRMTEEASARLGELVERTAGYSGAEIEGVVKAAASYALERGLLRKGAPLVGWEDLQTALGDVKPAKDEDEAPAFPPLPAWGYLDPTQSHRRARERLGEVLVALPQLPRSSSSSSSSAWVYLVHGPTGVGKSALLSWLARQAHETAAAGEATTGMAPPTFISLPPASSLASGESRAALLADALAKVLAQDGDDDSGDAPPPLSSSPPSSPPGRAKAILIDGLEEHEQGTEGGATVHALFASLSGAASAAATGGPPLLVVAAMDTTTADPQPSPALAALLGRFHGHHRLPLLGDPVGEVLPTLRALLLAPPSPLFPSAAAADAVLGRAAQLALRGGDEDGGAGRRTMSMRGLEGAARMLAARATVQGLARRPADDWATDEQLLDRAARLLLDCLESAWI